MWTITFKNRPITLGDLEILYKKHWNLEHPNQFIAFKHKKDAIEMFLFYIGYDWEQRITGIECKRITRRS